MKFTIDTEGVLYIEEDVEEIPNGSFLCNEKIKRIGKFPNSLKRIGEQAFASSSIEEIEIPDSVEEIGEQAFKGCKNLKAVKLPNSLQFTELYITSNLLLTIYKLGWITKKLKTLVIDDLIIEGEKCLNFKLEKDNFIDTSLEDFAESLLSIRSANKDTRKFIQALHSYFKLSKESGI